MRPFPTKKRRRSIVDTLDTLEPGASFFFALYTRTDGNSR